MHYDMIEAVVGFELMTYGFESECATHYTTAPPHKQDQSKSESRIQLPTYHHSPTNQRAFGRETQRSETTSIADCRRRRLADRLLVAIARRSPRNFQWRRTSLFRDMIVHDCFIEWNRGGRRLGRHRCGERGRGEEPLSGCTLAYGDRQRIGGHVGDADLVEQRPDARRRQPHGTLVGRERQCRHGRVLNAVVVGDTASDSIAAVLRDGRDRLADGGSTSVAVRRLLQPPPPTAGLAAVFARRSRCGRRCHLARRLGLARQMSAMSLRVADSPLLVGDRPPLVLRLRSLLLFSMLSFASTSIVVLLGGGSGR